MVGFDADYSEVESVTSDVLYQGRSSGGNRGMVPGSNSRFHPHHHAHQQQQQQYQSYPGQAVARDFMNEHDHYAEDYLDFANLPEHACAYCGIHNPASVAKCVTCNKWFCNERTATNKNSIGTSHIVNHLVRSRHKVVSLHAESQLGDLTLECYNCGNRNIFLLGFIAAKADSVVVILCRHPCASTSSSKANWNIEDWQPLIEDRALLDWVLSAPSENEKHESRPITGDEIIKLEDLWTENPAATLKDIGHVNEDSVLYEQVKLRYTDGYEYQRCYGPLVTLESDYQKKIIESQKQSNVSVSWDIGVNHHYYATFMLSSYNASSSDAKIKIGDGVKITFEGFGPTWSGSGYVSKVPDAISEEITVEITNSKNPPAQFTDNYSVEFEWSSVNFIRMQNALRAFAATETSVSSYVYHKLMGHDVDDFTLDIKLPGTLSAPGIAALNDSQKNAVETVLRQPLALIQGPPGTGKTVVSTAIVYQLQKMYKEPVLVCAPSNVAVDQLADRISKTGLKVVRMVAKSRETIDSRVMHLTLHHMISEGVNQKKGKKSELCKLIQLRNEQGGLDVADAKKYFTLLRQAENSLLVNADVICCTCSGAGDKRLNRMRFRATLIDESTQATEPECLIPIVHGCKQVILVGDHKQLGPVVGNRKASNYGLSQSMFERLVSLSMKPIRLTVQYRMHPSLSQFPSNMFYDGELQNGVSEEERTRSKVKFPWPVSNRPTFFWSNLGSEEISASGTSYLNRSEAVKCEKIISKLLELKVDASQIGVVTPYEGQRAYITQHLLSTVKYDVELVNKIEIESVDAFQGREKDYIVLSCVRSNESQGIGFLRDARRMNVAITRAKYGLIVLGNPKVLSKNALWAHFLAHYKQNKCLVEGPLSTLREAKVTLSKPRIPIAALRNSQNGFKPNNMNNMNMMNSQMFMNGGVGGYADPMGFQDIALANGYWPQLSGGPGFVQDDDTLSLRSLPRQGQMSSEGADEAVAPNAGNNSMGGFGYDFARNFAADGAWSKDMGAQAEKYYKMQRFVQDDDMDLRVNLSGSMSDRMDQLAQTLENAVDELQLRQYAEEEDDEVASVTSSFANRVGLYD